MSLFCCFRFPLNFPRPIIDCTLSTALQASFFPASLLLLLAAILISSPETTSLITFAPVRRASFPSAFPPFTGNCKAARNKRRNIPPNPYPF
ncbi:hypothetical protein AVEN_176720-1 [Araneus ventricosus]|uniref:Uncharacterized protein n=1 Tax=Araneus ventricosus TaxID=182803 RepID=A0A4Y2UQI7_ARAVE|nr:hypothetical protein AVEN_176720-1 [Araneus ventricosus]